MPKKVDTEQRRRALALSRMNSQDVSCLPGLVKRCHTTRASTLTPRSLPQALLRSADSEDYEDVSPGAERRRDKPRPAAQRSIFDLAGDGSPNAFEREEPRRAGRGGRAASRAPLPPTSPSFEDEGSGYGGASFEDEGSGNAMEIGRAHV